VIIHFIGIGGIGLSGLARYLKHNGHSVSGSDIMETKLTTMLRNESIPVTIPHHASSIPEGCDLVIHSAVIKKENPEYKAAKTRGIRTLSRKEALPMILGDKTVYSVCGAHGKSTTTAILTAILEASAIIGAESKQFGSNVQLKEDNTIVFEADESDSSFLNSNPFCAIVTNAEPEHMEHYAYDYDLFYSAYKTFLEKAKIRVINAEDPYLKTLTDLEAIRLFPSQDITNLRYEVVEGEPYTFFDLKDLGEFRIWGFGEHMALDASLAILAAQHEMDIEAIRTNIVHYKGIKKRFDIIAKRRDYALIDDYGHHPTEIEATIRSAKLYAKLNGFKEITAVWQPHKYSRTLHNLERFKECFKGVDRLVILPVWSAGEEAVELDLESVLKEHTPFMACDYKSAKVSLNLDSGLVIGFGAGDITYQLREAG